MSKHTQLAWQDFVQGNEFMDVLKSQCHCYEDEDEDTLYECIVCSAVTQIEELEETERLLQIECERLEALCKAHGINYEEA